MDSAQAPLHTPPYHLAQQTDGQIPPRPTPPPRHHPASPRPCRAITPSRPTNTTATTRQMANYARAHQHHSHTHHNSHTHHRAEIRTNFLRGSTKILLRRARIRAKIRANFFARPQPRPQPRANSRATRARPQPRAKPAQIYTRAVMLRTVRAKPRAISQSETARAQISNRNRRRGGYVSPSLADGVDVARLSASAGDWACCSPCRAARAVREGDKDEHWQGGRGPDQGPEADNDSRSGARAGAQAAGHPGSRLANQAGQGGTHPGSELAGARAGSGSGGAISAAGPGGRSRALSGARTIFQTSCACCPRGGRNGGHNDERKGILRQGACLQGRYALELGVAVK